MLIIHNWHRSDAISGENRTVEGDIALLRHAGVELEVFSRSNDELAGFGPAQWAGMALRPVASPADLRALRRHIRRFRPDLVHLHNPMPLLSPWVVRTAHATGVPVVQTVNNYLHVCIAGNFFRDGRPCHDCRGRRVLWPGTVHGCYHDSLLQSAPLSLSLTVHRRTWRLIERFIAVGRAVARHLETMGIDPAKISVRGNPVADPGTPESYRGTYALYLGRLSPEKGPQLLLEAWDRSQLGRERRLILAGDGPDKASIEKRASVVPGVEALGFVQPDRALDLIPDAAFVVVPSLWEEPFGLTVVEAMARGKPVLCTNLGEPPEIVGGVAGWVAEPTVDAFRAALQTAFASPLEEIGRAARRRYEERYSPEAALRGLLEVYDKTLGG